MTRNMAEIKKGAVVKVQVVETRSSGVHVRLDDGRKGFIPNRELSWKRSRGEPEHFLSEGDVVEAIVLSDSTGTNAVELSLKQAHGNPWIKVQEGAYRPGMVVVGEVVNIEHFGAFIELEPGIDALLHISQIPGSDDQEIQNLLWVGDQIEVRLLNINYEEEQIDVVINTDLTTEPERTSSQVTVTPLPASITLAPPPPPVESQPCRVLIIDNDCDWATAFADLLNTSDCQVEVICDQDQILALLHPTPLDFEIAFIDIQLACTSGIELAGRIRSYNPEIGIFLITGLTEVDKEELPDDLNISSILFKPLNYATVTDHLRRLRSQSQAQHDLRDDTSSRDRLSSMSFALRFSDETPGVVMQEVMRETRAESAFLFSVDMFTEEVKIIEALAENPDVVEQVHMRLDLLRFSSVKDVAFENEPILERRALNSKRLGKLPHALYFESCVGVRVPFFTPDTNHVLFLFQSNRDHFHEVDLKLASAAAYRIAAQFQQKKVFSLLVDVQRQVLNGQLVAQLTHEIRNQLNGMTAFSENLARSLNILVQEPHLAANLEWQKKHRNYISKVVTRTEEIARMVDHYLGLVKDDKRPTQINDLIMSIMHQLRPTAKDAGDTEIKYLTELHPELPITRIPAQHLRQVFLNIALNAVQQMNTRSRRGNSLLISTRYVPDGSGYPIEIRFTDTGPGIHRKWWEQIFDPGFTTRPRGTGLGLFISRALVESMGGQIFVEHSCMYTRTTFLIRLPVVGEE